MAIFRVFDTFQLTQRKWQVFFGTIEEGVIEPGMSILVPLNSATNVAFKIHSVEEVLRSGETFIGLTVVYDDSEEAEILFALNVHDEVLKVELLTEVS